MKIEKFNGKGDVVVRTITDENINGVSYAAGDIVAYIERVDVSVSYDTHIANATSAQREITNVDYHPDLVQITNVPNTKEIRNLLYSEEESHSSISFTRQVEEIAKGEILLNTQRSILEIKMFSNGEPIEFVFDNNRNSVTIEETYTNIEIFIFTSQNSIDYRLKKPTYGYLNLLIVIEGKFGEKAGEFSMNIPKAVLLTDPSFSVSEDSYGTDLLFAIISDRVGRNKPVVSYIGEE